MKKLLSVLLMLCLLCGIAILPAGAEETMTAEVGPMSFQIPSGWYPGWGAYQDKPGLWQFDLANGMDYVGSISVLDYAASGVTLDITDGDEHMDNFAAIFAYANSYPATEWSEAYDATPQALEWAPRAKKTDGVMPDGTPLYIYSYQYTTNIDGVQAGPFMQFRCSYYHQGYAFLLNISGAEATQEILYDIATSCVLDVSASAAAPVAPAAAPVADVDIQTVTAGNMTFMLPGNLEYQQTLTGTGSSLHHYACEDYQVYLCVYDYALAEQELDLTDGSDQVDNLYCLLRIFFGLDGETALTYVNASYDVPNVTLDGGDTVYLDQGTWAMASHYYRGCGFLIDVEMLKETIDENINVGELVLDIALSFRRTDVTEAEMLTDYANQI